MKPFALLFLAVVVGWAASGVDWSREAVAQQDTLPPVSEPPLSELQQRIGEWRKGAAEYSQIGRYQISACATNDNDACFVVDTTSGKVWKVGEGESIVISSKLPE